MGHSVAEIVTGKPAELGGTEERRSATGLGVVYVIAAAIERLGWDLQAQRFAIQGFGNVGGAAARALHDAGAKVVGFSDVTGGLVGPGGLPIPAITDWVREN